MAQASPYFLSTPRLAFRHWTVEDLELALGLWGDPRVTRFIDARGALSRAQVRERLDAEIDLQRQHGVQYWPFFLRTDDTHAGCCGLHPRDPERRILELGCHVRAESWRRGLATEASVAVIAHAFDALGATALFAGHNPGNDASRHLLERLGFRYTHDEPYPPTGLEHPSYTLSGEDWARRRS